MNGGELVSLREWTLALSALVAAAAANALIRAPMRTLGKDRGWPLLSELAPAIANLMYVLGLRVFAELAPLNAGVVAWLDSFIYIVAVLIGLHIVHRAALVAIQWWIRKPNGGNGTLEHGFIPLLRNLVTILVFFTGAIMVLKRFNYDVMSLLTALGVGSLAVGLAAKETLSNMISGFTLIIDRNLRPGDRIVLGAFTGDVQEIGLRSTRLKTPDGNMLFVPNFDLVNNRILNLSEPSCEAICSTALRVPLEVPFGRIQSACLEAGEQVALKCEGRAPWVSLDGIGDGYQKIGVGFWVARLDDQGPALSDFNQRLLARLQADRIPLCPPPA